TRGQSEGVTADAILGLFDKPAARITEQDAWEVATSVLLSNGFVNGRDYIDPWLNREGRALLNKLNADREQVPAVVKAIELLKVSERLFSSLDHDLDRKLQAKECRRVIADLEIIADPSHSQRRCNIGNAESHDKELQVTIEHNGKVFGVDESISEFVQLLNSVGLETVASCSGHGHRPANIALKDGREIIIARNYEEGREI